MLKIPMNKSSFTSAGRLPAKILRDTVLIDCLKEGAIPPIHPQIIPTNRCNLNCGFCSCRNRDKEQEIPVDRLESCLQALARLGARAITITGGGEPTLYPHINRLIGAAKDLGLNMGMVTNGVLLHRMPDTVISLLTWCRISASDEADRLQYVAETINGHPEVDWALSYVLTPKPDLDNILRHVRFASDHRLTHIRLVSDLVQIEDVPEMETIRRAVADANVRDDLVIYQGRKEFCAGSKECRISLLKPLIGADGNVYPCCGVQYAQDNQALDLPAAWSMGHISDIEGIYARRLWFDGSRCDRCYYDEYNAVLEQISGPLTHAAFV